MAPIAPSDLKLKILGFLGSTREGRMCDRVATLVKNFYAQQKDGHTLEIIGKSLEIQLSSAVERGAAGVISRGPCLKGGRVFESQIFKATPK